eukprot:4562515-Pyramimonas_sp.AAC.1
MAVSSMGSGPPGVGTPCAVKASILQRPPPEPAAASAACIWDALASATSTVGVVRWPPSASALERTSSLICSCALGLAIARVVPVPSASPLPIRDLRVITSSAPTSLTAAMS